ncbi:prepilin peptidase [Cellulomonas fimi]|uniref:Prepilin peptidase n=1 Tax=Cellulomonas fimi (strain ATCC 484 / DSM 20113 / JCM 1341 / CCUG 24087 / LMG 16345 / NBRC 15513 / NCIMB 8980 / NCTC 7547 / NRS-133) TaxID=590998 RepID=F4H080_CELFA|nr:A24 family peptidase [Cellulomonas fimi]AEE46127.1 Prepilin peptidase [Cellulomonas fimi ATCC 484]NNH08427.1 prepilin peptidase [Cellulomonas fimi]VEH31738.1 Leader peptidase pppA [Cellulomonas fimi]
MTVGELEILRPALPVVVGLFGLLVGSFLNVVVWRVPRGESVVHPPSACPRCGHRIRGGDNVPVVSWLLLRGRCRDCAAPISARYPAVELATGLLFAGVAWWTGPAWVLPALLYLVAISVALTLIDIDVRRLPDVIVLPSYLVSTALLALAAANPGGDADWASFGRALAGGGILLAGYFVVWRVYPPGTGFGDVKLAGVLGLYLGWCGWGSVAVGWFSGYLVGGVFSIALVVAGRAGRKTRIPYGPWMILGAWIGIIAGETVWSAYLGVF